MMFRKVLAAGLTSIAFVSAAHSADIYRAEQGGYKDGLVYTANTWTGFYAGINGGYAWNTIENDVANTTKGGFGGVQLGYNWQGGLGFGSHLVFGIEADIQGASINDTNYPNTRFGALSVPGELNANLDYFGSVRARVGYAFDRALLYFTGGFAYGGVDNTLVLNTGERFSNSDIETGYTLGGGFEYKFNPTWSLKAEYQYLALDNSNLTNARTFVRPARDENDYNVVHVGVNYHFNKGYESLK